MKKFLRFAGAIALIGSLTIACKKNDDSPNATQDDEISMNAYDSTYIYPFRNDAVSSNAKITGFKCDGTNGLIINSTKVGDSIVIKSPYGKMAAIKDSIVYYKPNSGFLGKETITYYADDNGKSVAGNIKLSVGNKAQLRTDSILSAYVNKTLLLFAIDADTSYGYNSYNNNYMGDIFSAFGAPHQKTISVNAQNLIVVGTTSFYTLLNTGVVQMIADDGKKVFFEIVGPYQTKGHRKDGSVVTLTGLEIKVGNQHLYFTNQLK